MTQIIVKNPHVPPPAPEDYIEEIDMSQKAASRRTIHELLLIIGIKLDAKEGLPPYGLRLPEIAALCRKYRLRWKNSSTRAKALEQALGIRPGHVVLIHGCGIQIECYEVDKEEARGQEVKLYFKRVDYAPRKNP